MPRKSSKPNGEGGVTTPRASRRRRRGTALEGGLRFERRFTRPGTDPFDEIEWEVRDALIASDRGEVIFEQKDVEIPKAWSMTATNVVVSKYFRGDNNTDKRERSVRQLVSRVVDTLTRWGEEGGYFASAQDRDAFHDELVHLVLHQKMAFNSPVWFNVGVVDNPQCSACFINSVQDSMESILDLAKTEGMLFKWGSGAGSNLSRIRSSREKLRGGGTASGPVSFMKGYDAFAGVIKSGGKTRRAAKMVILNADRFGLSQLHQLRGRVGRGEYAGACLLSADPATPDGERRIEAMVESNDGFELAKIDLEIRGQGTVFGGTQSGAADLRLGDILRDHELLTSAHDVAEQAVKADPNSPFVEALMHEAAMLFGDSAEWLTRS